MIEYTLKNRVLLAGQPEPEEWAQLAARGYHTVINLRSDPERAAIQQRNAEAAGLRYIHLPLPAYELEAPHLEIFRATLGAPTDTDGLVIHCRTASRVALLWMLHRVVNEGWSQEEAEAELRAAGYGDDSMETFCFCAEDYFERAAVATADD